MASICMSQANYQQQHHHHLQQQFQLLNGSNAGVLLQQQQMTAYSKRQVTAPPPTTKAPLGTSHLQNIQPRVVNNGTTRLVGMLPKKKYNYANMPYGEQQLPSVQRRNARERNRVKQVNNGFTNLRQHLPQTVINTLSHGGRGASKKLSKVDTLRIAVEYIRGLQDLLDDAGATSSSSSSFSSAAATFQLNDDYSNDGSNFDDDSQMGSPAQDASTYQPMPQYHSEASASPTPSYTDSDISIGGVNYLQPITLEVTKSQQQPQHQSIVTQQMHFKFEPFDTYEQPNDEELLDYISSWQQQ